MKKSEIIKTHQDELEEKMIECYKAVVESWGKIQIKVYIWTDGDIDCFEEVQGDNAYYVPRNGDDRDLYHVATIASPCLDLWDYYDDPIPDDENEREAAEAEVVEYLVDGYRENIHDTLDWIIREAKTEEDLFD